MGVVKIRNEESVEEWCIVEFQGELKGSAAGETIGTIKVGKDGSAGMVVGQHEFKGAVVKLSRPFLVTEKVKATGLDSAISGENLAGVLDVRGIVRRKLLFNKRPKVTTKKSL